MRSSVPLAAMAVVGFVACSLVLKSLARLVLAWLRLAEDPFGQSAEYVLVTAISMSMVRTAMNLLHVRYDGRMIVAFFAAISVLVMTFALSSGLMRVDFLMSLLQMAALCLFAYLQFWKRDEAASDDAAHRR